MTNLLPLMRWPSFLLILMISMQSYGQQEYYVATSGSNANSGSIGNPWQTIQYGVSQLGAGDILNIRGGTYLGKIDVVNSGALGQEIIIRSYSNEQAIIDGTELGAYQYLLKIENADYITIEGIQFSDYQNLDAQGIRVVNSSHINIWNNTFLNIDYAPNALGQTPNDSQNSQPIIVYGRDPITPIRNISIANNTVTDCEVGYSECIAVNGNVDGFSIINNHVFNNTNIPIVAIGHEGECPDPVFDQARNGVIKNNLIHDNPSAYAACAGIYIDGGKSIVVENNISYNNDYGIELGCENNGNAPNDPSASDIIIRNNQLYNNRLTGLALGGYNYPTSGKVVESKILNNTFFNNDTDADYNGEMFITYVEDTEIENNIFYTNNSEKVFFIISGNAPNLNLNYNVYFMPSGANDMAIEVNGTGYYEFSTYQTSTGQDAASIFADPSFVSATIPNPNLHLQSSSVAIDKGNPGYDPGLEVVDIDGGIRRLNDIVECGGDEFGAEQQAYVDVDELGITLSYNPYEDRMVVQGEFGSREILLIDEDGNTVADYSGQAGDVVIELIPLGVGPFFLSIGADNGTSDQTILELRY